LVSRVQILIRRIRRDRKGNEELLEQTIDGASLSIGHRNDQTLQLLDPQMAPSHAVLRARRGGAFDLRCIGAARVQWQGRSVAKARLAVGQSLQIGQQTLTAAAPPQGFDAALDVLEIEQGEAHGATTHFVIGLERAGLRGRPLAWALLLLIPLLFLALPLAGFHDPLLGEWLRGQKLLPSDAAWSSGPLANAHHTPDIGSDCNACHVKLFEPTPDRACLACHEAINEHYDQQRVESGLLGAMKCATCHKEHNEPGNLVRHDSALCLDCHRDLEQVAEHMGMGDLAAPVSGFSPGKHPEFQLSLLGFDDAQWTWSQLRIRADSQPPPRETSNLRFPHDLHMDPQWVRVPGTDLAMGCVDCHRLGTDREHFVPITMESHCRSCHSLAFDEAEPGRQLPHADVPWAVLTIEEHFIRRFVDPSLRLESTPSSRRRPGRIEEPPMAATSPLAMARERAELEARNQFSRSGCVTCHEVTEHPERPLRERWRVKPVRIVADWYPNARFDHAVHLTPGASGPDVDKACLSCHAADVSSSSEDILMPDIDSCFDCHGDVRQVGVVKLDCTSCHGFHQATGSPLKMMHGLYDAYHETGNEGDDSGETP